jgi:hypothetical protein
MSSVRIGSYTPEDARAIHEIVLGRGVVGSRLDPPFPTEEDIPAVLSSDLSPATNPLTGSTVFNFIPLRSTSVATNADWEVSPAPAYTGRNRTQASGEVGTFILVRNVRDEFMPVWVDCSATQAVVDAIEALTPEEPP